MTAAGRFFITPTAIEQWRTLIAPGCTEAEALADIIEWAEDARPQVALTAQGLQRYRARHPLRCYFLVAPPERGRLLPSIVAVAPPHPGWRPPGQHGGPRPGSGRPPVAGLQPEFRCRLPADVQEWIRSQGQGWLERLVRGTMPK